MQERLAAQGSVGGLGDTEHPVLQALSGIVEEVLALPEAITYISSDTRNNRRSEVQDMARAAVTDNLTSVSATGSEQYIRFKQARNLMAAAVGNPVWSRPVRLYGFLAAIAASVALVACGFVAIHSVGLFRVVAGAIGIISLMYARFQQRRVHRGSRTEYKFALNPCHLDHCVECRVYRNIDRRPRYQGSGYL